MSGKLLICVSVTEPFFISNDEFQAQIHHFNSRMTIEIIIYDFIRLENLIPFFKKSEKVFIKKFRKISQFIQIKTFIDTYVLYVYQFEFRKFIFKPNVLPFVKCA